MRSSEPPLSVGADPYGDFQTPPDLAAEVWGEIDLDGVDLIIEPTIGLGGFARAAPADAVAREWLAWDVNSSYVEAARGVFVERGIVGSVEVLDIFDLAPQTLAREVAGKVVLAVGNPPWVTNAGQGHLAGHAGQNLPAKNNRFGLKGLDALTGKANFDIAEAILLALIDSFGAAKEVRLAFLVKRSVATKLARQLLGREGVISARFSSIDARKSFGAAVEAGLFSLTIIPNDRRVESTMDIRREIGSEASSAAGFLGGIFVEDIHAYAEAENIEAHSGQHLGWRQGLKHDLSKVLELRRTDGGFQNGFGEDVEVEPDIMAPLFKSSDLANGREARRWFPLYQTDLSGPFVDLADSRPKLSAYLNAHRDKFDARRSRIYRDKPPFMLFGVGEYTVAPFKVAVSGFYSEPVFRLLEPAPDGNPPLVDDTCYILPFWQRDAAEEMLSYLESGAVQGFLRAVADRTAKRPYTKAVLGRIRDPRAGGADGVGTAGGAALSIF